MQKLQVDTSTTIKAENKQDPTRTQTRKQNIFHKKKLKKKKVDYTEHDSN